MTDQYRLFSDFDVYYKETVMSRINYSNNPTDCNYSFCDEKENIPPNQDELTRILKRHYHLHLKNAHTMRQQASQIERMQIALTSIQRQLSQNHSISTISHYASGHSAYHQQSIEFFPNKHTSRGKSKGSSSKSNSNGSYYRHSKPQQSSRQSSTNKS